MRTSKKVYLYSFYTPVSFVYGKYVPSGMLTLSWCLKNAGYEVVCNNINTKQLNINTLPAHDDALFVGMCSICFSQYFYTARDISRHIKQSNPDVNIAWGGDLAALNVHALLAETYVDIVGLGAGEEAIVGIADALLQKKSLADIPGLGYKENGSVFITGRARIQNLDNYDYDFDILDLNEYIVAGRLSGPFSTSRGCPNRCTFCCNSRENRDPYRAYSPQKIHAILSRLKEKYTFDVVDPGDPNFFLQKERAIGVCKVWRDLGVRPTMLDAYASDLDKERIIAAAECNTETLFIGLESFNQRILDLCNKKQNIQRYFKAIEDIQTYAPNIMVASTIICAFPFQTYEEFRQDIIDAFRAHDRFPGICMGFVCLIPTSGTKMMAQLNEVGYFHKDVFEDAIVSQDTLAHVHKWCSWAGSLPGKQALWYAEKVLLHILRKARFGIADRVLQNIFKKIALFRISHDFYWGMHADKAILEFAFKIPHGLSIVRSKVLGLFAHRPKTPAAKNA